MQLKIRWGAFVFDNVLMYIVVNKLSDCGEIGRHAGLGPLQLVSEASLLMTAGM